MSDTDALFQIHPNDNVGVRLSGDKCGHKFALKPIRKGESVIKYGMPIGTATTDIVQGEWVHTHNLKTGLRENVEYVYSPVSASVFPAHRKDTFSGYVRSDGQVGIRNDIWIIPTVGCVNRLAVSLAQKFNRKYAGKTDYDGMEALALSHPYGCSQLGSDHERTQNLLANLCRHPNAGGVLVVSLGCENNTLESFQKRLGDTSHQNIRFLKAQDVEDEYVLGEQLLDELAENAGRQKRVTCDISKLRVGLKCGGSDGFSGITANPLTGRFSDILVIQGGAAVLSEVPEMFGAETLLMNRCRNENIFRKCVTMINDFKQYFISHGQTVYENPSPGNKAGGISSLEDKSLGCVQKGGCSCVSDVYQYGERIHSGGLNLISGPGNDMVASTVLAAAGCQLILFTTGRGTPYGTVVPTVKISTNTALAERKKSWIDFDAGRLLSGEKMESLANELFDFVLEISCGKKRALNEIHDYREIAIFKDGVTL